MQVSKRIVDALEMDARVAMVASGNSLHRGETPRLTVVFVGRLHPLNQHAHRVPAAETQACHAALRAGALHLMQQGRQHARA